MESYTVGAFVAAGKDDIEQAGFTHFAKVFDDVVIALEPFGESFDELLLQIKGVEFGCDEDGHF